MPAAAGQLRGDSPDPRGQVGYSRTAHPVYLGTERAGDSGRHAADRRGDAGRRGRDPHRDLQRASGAGPLHPRDGHGADGTGSPDLGPQPLEPESRRPQSLRDRRCLHDLGRQPESLDHLHGAHRPRLCLRGRADAEARAVNRRNFLHRSAAGLAALSLPRRLDAGSRAAGLDHIGVQLYTVREPLERDFDGTLAKVAAAGYREVEMAGYFGRSAAQVRDALRRAGLSAPSAHVPLASLGDGWERVLADARTVGHRYLVMPWLDEEYRNSLDSYRRIADRLNRAGEAAGPAR